MLLFPSPVANTSSNTRIRIGTMVNAALILFNFPFDTIFAIAALYVLFFYSFIQKNYKVVLYIKYKRKGMKLERILEIYLY